MSACRQRGGRLDAVRDEDFTIFPTGGERHDALPWIIKSYEQGAFSDEQKKEICHRFTLELAQVETLSSYIGNCLDIETSLGFYPLNKARATAQGKAALRKALRYARAKSPKEAIQPLLENLSSIFAQNRRTNELLASLDFTSSDFQATLEELVYAADVIALRVPMDRRTLRDARRIEVVEHCCYVWHEAGRRLAVTTDSSQTYRPQRSGELIDFIQWVIRLVTAPQCSANVETLRTDIQRFRKHMEAPSFLTEEPVFGRQSQN